MPELPEVETVKRILLAEIKNWQIKQIRVYYEPIMPEAKLFDLSNQVILDVERIGKFLIFKLSNYVLVAHMRMEGRFFIKDDFEQKNQHEHVKISFTNNKSLRYVDTRKFGRILIKSYNDYLTTKPLVLVAPEPHLIKSNDLFEKLQRRTTPIKVSLLNQHLIAGLGNIYVDETLFLAKVLPTRKSNEVTKKEVELLLDAADKTLQKATELGGTTLYTYEASEGVHGRFQNELLVHSKVGEPCPICKTKIEKIKVGGRGTYVCFKCQK